MEIVSNIINEESGNRKRSRISHICSGKCLRYAILGLALSSVFVATLLWYFCDERNCFAKNSFPFVFNSSRSLVKLRPSNSHIRQIPVFRHDKLSMSQFDFNIRAWDVVVFLHIQNTGGNVFAKQLVEDLNLEKPCVCKKNRRRCVCWRPNRIGSPWLFSRYTMGWKCGVHPDWTELTNCVDRVVDEEEGRPIKRRYFFITLLRDPVKRFLSEYWHARQGLNWRSSRHWCNGKETTPNESCFEGKDLQELTLDEFLSCTNNLALNRQTRMLADLTLVGCYNTSFMSVEERNLLLLTSAKNNLHKMAFFGLSEFPKMSQYMFESIFNLSFVEKEQQLHNIFGRRTRRKFSEDINAKDIKKIEQLNQLDIAIYQYAKDLLFHRFEKLKNIDPHFKNNFEMIKKSQLSSVDWAEKEDSIDIL
ncbi:heparan-sulfate 6-O-sulfotransferase 1-like [Centruroides sculpturatus]|uniref:heparan-sulfate 6-O-sulfotransferase 1-like n=1 Tax=Centruroides sculpturatus TaxID=218467 RepID=UPI000C6CF38B|nr:heparan-sulfate 6-O-sulfotransferase 1-like [Centruroides sculpturatus]